MAFRLRLDETDGDLAVAPLHDRAQFAPSKLSRRAVLALGASLALGLVLGSDADAAGLPPPRPAPGRSDVRASHDDGFVWPTNGEITTHFGEVGPYSPRGHKGLDIAAASGTPIVAAEEGRVKLAAATSDGYGIQVLIEHPDGTETRYAHLSRLAVQSGERVDRGQLIGSMGSTGYSTGPHLHFEVIQDGALRDPMKFLP
jgi:murein DD-endopeptidase MepM/ murein hydrolase activator NlpD